ncbi:DUF5590 domain-containing protein [Paenibacillus ferrarius]|uniref:cell wall elongation regulator TseB-like domain-containing protein n=1 Tax=Paenibacillus ferrarius TaxID=1469647 RepID=UPI003D2945F9
MRGERMKTKRWRWRWIVLGVFIVATLGVVLSHFYLNLQGKHWDEKRVAVEKAFAGSMMTEATNVDFFYGDEPVQIVYGENKLNQPMIVWISEGGVHAEMTSEGFTKEQARIAVLKKAPNASIERIMPGKLGGEYVWEVFYKQKENDHTRYYYDYYKFKDGTFLDTFRLSLQ